MRSIEKSTFDIASFDIASSAAVSVDIHSAPLAVNSSPLDVHSIEAVAMAVLPSRFRPGLMQGALIQLPADSIAPLALLLVAPLLLLGADYLFDELLKVHEGLRKSLHFRSLLYIAVTAVTVIVLLKVKNSDGYLETIEITSGTLIQVLLILVVLFIATKMLMKKRWESRRKKSIEKLELELPQYLEMFHILITSGMSVLSALKILGEDRSDTPSSTESSFLRAVPQKPKRESSAMRAVIREILVNVERGTTIEKSLDIVVFKAGSEQLRRFSDAVILGMERGSSMGQTLKNLISETRNQSKILVMQRAGKAEIQLLIPVVFLILPISVMFAIWPSYVNLVSIMG